MSKVSCAGACAVFTEDRLIIIVVYLTLHVHMCVYFMLIALQALCYMLVHGSSCMQFLPGRFLSRSRLALQNHLLPTGEG